MDLYQIRLNLELNPGTDRVYTVTSPDVPGLTTEGRTFDEIQKNVQDAINVMMAVYREQGWELPLALQPEQARPIDKLDLVQIAV